MYICTVYDAASHLKNEFSPRHVRFDDAVWAKAELSDSCASQPTKNSEEDDEAECLGVFCGMTETLQSIWQSVVPWHFAMSLEKSSDCCEVLDSKGRLGFLDPYNFNMSD